MEKELKKLHLAKCIKKLSGIEVRQYANYEIYKSVVSCIKDDIALAHSNNTISMKTINDVTIFRGLSENEILAILG